ncbi:MAG: alpha/beta fold hydrolase [Candidatus Omnitrophica bacterium]|nr:alpha/beta fold hydrolase [Candidatus Omnitrophota bacterium]
MALKIVKESVLTEDQHRISCLHYASGHDRCLVISHGFYNSKDALVLDDLARSLASEYDVVLFDLRGHGESSGLFTWISKEGNDLKAVLAAYRGRYRRTGLVAFSLGGSIAINTLAREPLVDSFVCVSAPASLWGVNYHFWELSFQKDFVYTLIDKAGRKGKGVRPGPFWLKKERPIDNVGKLVAPVLFIHGTRDWVVKPSHSQRLFDRTVSPKKLVIFKDAPHAEYLLRDNRERFIAEVRAWFTATLR